MSKSILGFEPVLPSRQNAIAQPLVLPPLPFPPPKKVQPFVKNGIDATL